MDVPSLLTTSAPECPTNPFPPAFLLYGFRLSKESHSRTFPPLCLHDQEGSRKQEEDGHTKWTMLVPLPSPTSTILYTLPHPPFLLYFFLLPLSASFPLLSSPSLPYPGRAKWLRQNGFARTARAREKVSTQPQKESGMGGEDRGRQRLFHFSSLFLVLSFPKGEVSFFTRDIPTYHAAECCGRGKQRGPQTTAIFRK